MVKDKTDNEQAHAPDARRRQLLRGLSTVPVVATLTPVSASALSFACEAKAAPEPPTDVQPVTHSSVGGTYQCLPTATASPYTTPPLNVDVDDPFNGSIKTTEVFTGDPAKGALGEYNDGATTQQCAIYIDGSGQLTFVESTDTNPIGASCLLSITNRA